MAERKHQHTHLAMAQALVDSRLYLDVWVNREA